MSLEHVLGAGLGLAAGYVEGRLDAVLLFVADAPFAFPFVLLSITVVSMFGPGLTNVLLVLTLTGWVIFARVARAETLSLRRATS